MRYYDIISLAVVVVSMAGIIFIIVRKFPVLASIDIESIKSEQEAKQKEKIIASRLERKINGLKNDIGTLLAPFFTKIKNLFIGLYGKILDWEKEYTKKREKIIISAEEAAQKIKTLFFSAEESLREDKIDEAEKKYIEIISLDHKNIEAYKKLVDIYLEQKNYDYAIETLQYILKLQPNDVERLIDLGVLLRQRGENTKALKFFAKAVQLEPTNPKSLDFLIDISIIVGNRSLAEETLKSLKEVNPENQKLAGFEERIREM